MGLVSELRRRNVIRVAVAYAIAAWLLIQISATTFPMLRLPEWTATFVTVLLIIGFPVALIFAWAYELTPEGLKKEKDVVRSKSITHITGRKLDYLIIAVLVLALGYFAFDKFVLEPSRDAEMVQAATERVAKSRVAKTADNSIVVLPFTDLSPEGDQEYFSDGVSEEILNVLAQIPDLHVISRSSAFSFKGKGVDIPTVAKQLGVAHVLEGSVRKSGKRIRITAQLIDARTDKHLWSESYDRELENIFAVQDEISAAIVKVLKVRLLGHEAERLVAKGTVPEAYEAYLLGKHLLRNPTIEMNVKSAAEQFERATSIDANYAPAWAGRSLAARAFVYVTSIPFEDAYRDARAYAERAVEIDPDLDIAHRALGTIFLDLFEFVAAKQHFEMALSIGPGDAANVRMYAYLLQHVGRARAALSRYQQSLELDPLSIPTLYRLARTQTELKNLVDAEATIARIGTINSVDPRLPILRTLLALRSGEFSAAVEHAKGISDSRDSLKYTYLARAHGQLGEQDLADKYLRILIDRYGARAAREIALVYAQRGEPDRVFEWLERGWKAGDPGVMEINMNWVFEPLKEDPRFDAFLEKIGLKAIMPAD